MTDRVKIEVQGARELALALRRVPRNVAGRALTQATRKAMNPMRKAVRQAMPGHWRRLKRRVGIANVPGLNRRFQRGSRVGFTLKGFYARFLEQGTERMSARVFMLKAFRSTADTVVRVLADELWKAIAFQSAKEAARSPARRARGARR